MIYGSVFPWKFPVGRSYIVASDNPCNSLTLYSTNLIGHIKLISLNETKAKPQLNPSIVGWSIALADFNGQFQLWNLKRFKIPNVDLHGIINPTSLEHAQMPILHNLKLWHIPYSQLRITWDGLTDWHDHLHLVFHKHLKKFLGKSKELRLMDRDVRVLNVVARLQLLRSFGLSVCPSVA